MKNFLLTFTLTIFTLGAFAQEKPAPKWLPKVQKSVYSVITYDQHQEKLREGVGFAVSADGALVSDYATFLEAYSAVVIDAAGNKYDVERILGADDLYGLVRYRIANKKTTALALANPASANAGAEVVSIGYTKGKVNVVPKSTISKKEMVDSKYGYYTLANEFDGKQVGKGAFNANGELLGVILSPLDGKNGVIDAAMGRDLNLGALQSKSSSLAYNKIYIKKGIPDSPEEGLIYLYMKSRTAGNDEYMDLVNLFISTFPDNAEGYLRRATPLIDLERFDEADQDLQTYLRLVADKNQGNNNVAKTIYSKLVYLPEPDYPKWNYDVALSYSDKAIEGQRQRAAEETDADKKVMEEVSLVEYQLQKAQILSSKGDNQAALDIYDEVNAGKYKAPGTFLAASMAHEALGDTIDTQIALMDSAIAQFPDTLPLDAAGFVMRRARLYEKAKKFRQAVADFNTFATINNDNLSASFYYDRSQLEVQARMYQQALNDIDKAVEMAPNEPLYHVEKSAIHLRVNQLDECIEAAKKCIDISKEYPDAYRILGYAQIQKGDKTAARQNLERAKELGDETAQEIMDTYLK